jgi:hypothetical protein
MQYLIPTPEGQQPDLELAYLVVDGQLIPASEVQNPANFSIVIREPETDQQHEHEGEASQ